MSSTSPTNDRCGSHAEELGRLEGYDSFATLMWPFHTGWRYASRRGMACGEEVRAQ